MNPSEKHFESTFYCRIINRRHCIESSPQKHTFVRFYRQSHPLLFHLLAASLIFLVGFQRATAYTARSSSSSPTTLMLVRTSFSIGVWNPQLSVGFTTRRSLFISARQFQRTIFQHSSNSGITIRSVHSDNFPTSSTKRRRPFHSNSDAVYGIPIHMLNTTSTHHEDCDNGNACTSESSSKSSAMLEWDKFEYSTSPKIDTRFGKVEYNHTNSSEIPKAELLERLHEQETIYDEQYANSVMTQNQMWMDLPVDTIKAATVFLQGYIQNERIQRIKTVLQQRTKNVRFLFENPSNPSNVYACLRTIDAFGIQNVDIVTQSNQYRGKAAIYQKRNMRTAMGSAKWLTITNYISTEDAIRNIRKHQNCRIYASDLNPHAIDIRTIDWSNNRNTFERDECTNTSGSSDMNHDYSDRSICIVMGNEDSGISETMRQLVDATFTLPMVGFAESFNLSVATAVVLAHLSATSLQQQSSQTESTVQSVPHRKQHSWTGPIRPGDLSEREYNCLYLKALINSLPQKRMARGMLQTAGIILPKELIL